MTMATPRSIALVLTLTASALAAAPAIPPVWVGDGPAPAADTIHAEAHQAQTRINCPTCSRAFSAMQQLQWAEAAARHLASIETGLLDQTDVQKYALDLEIVPSQTRLIGTNVMTVNVVADNVTTFDFSLATALSITGMTFNGSPATYARLTAPTVRVTLPRPYNTGEQFTLSVSFNGIPVDEGFGSINFLTQGGNPLVFTLSEPYYSHTWWPVKDDNRDKAIADLNFVVPNTLKVASNGTLQGTDVVAGSKTRYRWKTNYQTAPYLFFFSATNYAEFTGSWTHDTGVMNLLFYIYPGSNTTTNRNAWLKTQDMLPVLSSKFGKYPFFSEKYGIYQFAFGGGMEHQTFTGQGTFDESVTAHELTHQWFGDMITCETWSDIWLNEGFATYGEALWLENRPGSTGLPALLAAMNSRKPTSTNGTVYCFDISDPNRIFSSNFSYRKGAWVLHMLRHLVGDTTFFNILAAYRAQYQFDAATTEEFKQVCQSVSGLDLTAFFNQWVYSVGAPAYQYNWRAVNAGGSNYAEIYLKQNQNAAWPTFNMPVDVTIRDGATDLLTKLPNDARTEYFLIPTTNAPSQVTFDPQSWILTSAATTTIAFVEGPPKIVKLSPAPGATDVPQNTPINITFHKNSNVAAPYYLLTDPDGASIPFNFSYNAANFTATMTPLNPLAGGEYTVSVIDAVTGVAGGQFLDGEITDPRNPASLPTGNGVPGGNALYKFTVATPPPPGCPGDTNNDSAVDGADLSVILAGFGTAPAQPGTGGDLNNDGFIDGADLSVILANFGTTCGA